MENANSPYYKWQSKLETNAKWTAAEVDGIFTELMNRCKAEDFLSDKLSALRVGIQNTLDLARTGLKPDHYASELDWLQHKINVIASELAGLLKG
jgi:hypothetical protein